MDQFGVLVESIGFKAHGKSSAPLADLKGTNKTNDNTDWDEDFSLFHRSKSAYNSHASLNVDDLDVIFRSSSNNNLKPPNPGFDDVFGGGDSGVNGVDLDSVFRVPNSNNYDDDDIFGLKKKDGSGSVKQGHVSAGKGSSVKKSVSIDDLFGNSSGAGMKSKGLRNNSGESQQNASKADDLLGNFGGMEMNNGLRKKAVKKQDTASETDDLLGNFGGMEMNNGLRKKTVKKQDTASETDDLLGNFGGMEMNNGLRKKTVKKQDTASETDDLLSGFAVKSPPSNGTKSKTTPSHQSSGHSTKSFSTSAEDPFVVLERTNGSSKANNGGVEDYLDSLFSPGTQSSTEDSVYDSLFSNSAGSKVEKASSDRTYGTNNASSGSTKKASLMTNSYDDYSYLFGMGDAPSSGEFQEIKGESEDRRRARLNHHMITQERMAKALNEKNQRDLQAQREQDEKKRIAATLDGDIKHWAAGKEGNLRALLSSLQYVLWPEAGWQPVSLTDLITSTSVKKAYYKATLCVHPDKVQQKGANIQQKYIAEKVFDLLKEAWNKFNAEEFKKQ